MLILKDDDLPIPIAVGITIGLLASLIQSLGLTIQRKSHVMNERKPDGEKKLEHRRPLWLLGFGIFLSSNILGSLFQIVSLPVVILAPLGAVSLLWNAFFARLILGDVFSPYMVFGTLAIAGGAVLIAIFGIVPEPIHSLDDLLLLLRRGPFVVYFSLLGVTVFVVLALTHITEFSLRLSAPSVDSAPQTGPRRALSLDADARQTTMPVPVLPVSEETALLGGKGAPAGRPSRSIRGTRLLLAVSYASVSGILSGMCLIFAKSGVELLLLTVQGENQFVRWESWALVVGLVVFALLQLWYLHKSLVLANPVLVCPLAFCLYNVSSIINGLIYYDQFGALSRLHIELVVVGIVVLLGGVWAVSVTSREGGGVEPGTWEVTEEEAEEEREEGEAGPGEALEERHSPFDGPRSPSRRRTRYGSLLGREGQGGSLSLSIGLSPTSPGFALRPTRRGMRRTASEGDVERWRWLRHVWRDNGR